MDNVSQLLDMLNSMNNFNNRSNILYLNAIRNATVSRKYHVRRRIDPFEEFDDQEFERRFRISKTGVKEIYDQINGNETLEPKFDRSPFTISGMVKLAIALRFYAVNPFYEALADMFGISKSLVETIIEEVSFLISRLRERFICIPSTPAELLSAKVDFMQMSRFPLCIAAVDGTHVLIQSFGGPYAEAYRNRHMVFSLNVQLASSADVRFYYFSSFVLKTFIKISLFKQERVLDVVSRWPGSAHDSTIFTHSNLYDRFHGNNFGGDSLMVVDSAYPPERFLCKPLNHPHGENEISYQRAQIKARNVAERVNGQLKREFAALKYGMRFKKKNTAQDVVVCCCVLHNMRKMAKQNPNQYSNEEIIQQNQVSQSVLDAEDNYQNQRQPFRIQNFLIQNHFD